MLPNRLKKQDTIGIIAPSDCVEKEDLEVINQSILLMESSGFRIDFGKHVFQNTLGYGASAREKAQDIMDMFINPNIKAIFCISGGFNSNSTLEYLDYKKIAEHPKILCGFSDSTSLLNVIYQKTGMITFHGPTFKSLTSWQTPYGYEQVMHQLVEAEGVLARLEDEFTTIQEGIAQGKLLGGNLSLIAHLSSGKYALDFKDKILFIEELSIETPPAMVSHYLYHMKQNGVFNQINGIWVGNYDAKISLEKILLDTLEGDYSFPIIKSNNFGHTEKKMVIPIGTKAKMDTKEELKIQLIEPCVN